MYVFHVPTERQYFEHLGTHLKKHSKTVFKDCDYSTNIYSTFSRKHNPHFIEDLKNTVFETHSSQAQASEAIEDNRLIKSEGTSDEGTSNETFVQEGEDLVQVTVAYCSN